ncbi:MAG: hypothetical protein AAGF23_02160 [Acidobacteriota bacterium]
MKSSSLVLPACWRPVSGYLFSVLVTLHFRTISALGRKALATVAARDGVEGDRIFKRSALRLPRQPFPVVYPRAASTAQNFAAADIAKVAMDYRRQRPSRASRDAA